MTPPPPAAPQPAPFRRRIVLIKRALQMKYVLLVFASVLLTVTIISVDFYYTVGKLILKEVGEINIAPIARNASLLLGLHLSVYLFIVIVISIFVSHKFAGPIFRLEKISEAVAEGDLTVQARFRKGDELFETAESINRMIESLREKVEREKNLSGRISAHLNELAKKLEAGTLAPQKAAAQLRELLLEVEHITSNFRT